MKQNTLDWQSTHVNRNLHRKNHVQATESKSKQCLQHLIPCEPSKPRVSPAIRRVINNVKVGQRGVLLQTLQLCLFSVSHTAAKVDSVALNCLRTEPTVLTRHPKGLRRVLREKRSCCCNFRRRHVFADLCKDFRQTRSSGAPQRHVGL